MGMTRGHYLFLGVLPEEAGEMADISALYAAGFGLPPAGKRVFIRTVQQINGWQVYSDNYFPGLVTIINIRKSHFSFLTQQQLTLL